MSILFFVCQQVTGAMSPPSHACLYSSSKILWSPGSEFGVWDPKSEV